MKDRYREYAPHPALRPFVACYWTSTAPAGAGARRILPDGCIDILFDLEDGGPRAGTIVGAMTRPFLFEPQGAVSFVAVRFRPGGAVPFLRLSADAITDAEVALTHVWRAGSLGAQLREPDGDEARVRRLEAALRARLADAPALDARIQHAVSLLEDGTPAIDTVAAAVGLSRQHLIRLFRQHVGLGPKRFARVMRMQRLRSRIDGVSRPDWAAVALDAGYYDQAHMIGECRELTGVTPTELARA